MLKHVKFQCLFVIFIVTNCFVYPAKAQENTLGFSKYNNRRISPFITYFHEFHVVSICAIDINYKEKVLGNLSPGMNYGLGLGYMFKFKVDNSSQSIGIGVNAEYYPSRFCKFNTGVELIGIGYGNDQWFASFLTGLELNLIYISDFSEKEMAYTLYLAHIGYNNLNVKFGLQSYLDRLMPNMDIDDTFVTLKLMYKFKF